MTLARSQVTLPRSSLTTVTYSYSPLLAYLPSYFILNRFVTHIIFFIKYETNERKKKKRIDSRMDFGSEQTESVSNSKN